MAMHEQYKLIFRNEKFSNEHPFNEKVVDVVNNNQIYFPLAEYLYMCGYGEAFDDVLSHIENSFMGNEYDPDISVGTLNVSLTPTVVTIKDSSGRIQTLPTTDLRALLLEYIEFFNSPPLNGSYV